MTFKTHLLATAMGAAAILSLASAAHAQAGPDGSQSSTEEGTQSEESGARSDIVVTATRSFGNAKDIPVKIEVFGEKEIRAQQTLATTNTELLANLVPSFAPSRQKLTGGGETFRGRTPLFLIDGVPQSTPLRAGSREGTTIDLEVIEKVEVLFGANALQGLGGTGGVINYVTVSAPKSGELTQRASLGLTTNDGFEGDGFGGRLHYLIGKDFGKFDFVAAASFEEHGLMYDAKDRAIGIDNESGDIADTFSRNFFGKIGWEPTGTQRVQLMVNRFYLEQHGNYVRIDGSRTLGRPAISVHGDPRGGLPFNDVVTSSFDYTNTDFLGGRFSVQAFYQNFKSLFGGQVTQSFQDPLIAPIGTLFDQSQNNSEKYGAKFTYGLKNIGGLPVDAVVGVDLLRDLTSQPLVLTGRVSVPPTTFYNYAPFVQLNVKPTSWLSISGGARHEIGRLVVPDFVTRAGNRADYQRVPVKGGTRRFTDTLFNTGLVLKPIDNLTLYGSYSQAFTVPDVGRVLRSVTAFGTSVDTLLDINPIVSTNKEFGGEYSTDLFRFSLSYFVSQSDFGQTLVPQSDGSFDLARQAVKTSGWEATVRVTPATWLDIGVGYSLLRGRIDSDSNGSLDSDLGAADIGPNRLSPYINITPPGRFSGRIQSFTYFDKDFRNRLGAVTSHFQGYTTVDASISYDMKPAVLSLSISNILDKQYITYYSQVATGSNALYYAGRGRTFTLRLGTTF